MRFAIALLTASIAYGQFFPFPGPGRAGSGGGGGTPNATFVAGTNLTQATGSTTIVAPSSFNVSAGNLIVVLVGGYNSEGGAGVITVACGSDSLTEATNSWFDPTESYVLKTFYKIGASANAAATCTATFNRNNTFRFIGAAHYAITGTATFGQSSCNDVGCASVAATSTGRTAQNVTTSTATTLLIGLGVDWNGATHSGTPPNSYNLRIDGDTVFWYDKVITSTGTHPSGSFGTVSATDQYISKFLTFGIS